LRILYAPLKDGCCARHFLINFVIPPALNSRRQSARASYGDELFIQNGIRISESMMSFIRLAVRISRLLFARRAAMMLCGRPGQLVHPPRRRTV